MTILSRPELGNTTDNAAAGTAKSTRSIQSIDRAIKILRELAGAADGVNLGELAKRCGIAVQTTQGLLRTLQQHGFVTQAGRAAPYYLGSELYRLGQIWISRRKLPEEVRQQVSQLCHKLGEYVVLAELRGASWTPLLEFTSNQRLVVNNENVKTSMLHTMATGKVLLAWQDPKLIDEIIPQLDFSLHGPASVTNPEKLYSSLKTIREQGYAICIDEINVGVAAIAVPVRDSVGNIAGLGTSVPLVRFDSAKRDELLNSLKTTAAKLEKCWPEIL